MNRDAIDATRSLKRYVAHGLGEDWEVRLNSEEGAFKRPFCRIDATDSTFGGDYSSEHTQDVSMSFALILYPKEARSPDDALMKVMAAEDRLWQMFAVGTATLAPPVDVQATVASGGSLTGTYRYRVVACNRYGKTDGSWPVTAEVTDGRVLVTWTGMPEAKKYQVFRGEPGEELWLANTTLPEYTDTGEVEPMEKTEIPVVNTARLGGPMRVPLYDYAGLMMNEAASDNIRPRGAFMRISGQPSVSRLVDPHDDLMWVVTANIRLSWRRSGVVPSEAPLIQSFYTSEDVA